MHSDGIMHFWKHITLCMYPYYALCIVNMMHNTKEDSSLTSYITNSKETQSHLVYYGTWLAFFSLINELH